jgi:PAS domain S-box-containing protein
MTSLRKYWALFVIVTIAILGIAFSTWLAERSERQLRADLLLHVQIIAETIDQNDVKDLFFNSADRTNPSFVRLSGWMKRIAHDVGCRILYSMIQRSDGIVFGPENLPVNDPASSSPGTLYKNPPAKLKSVFQNHKAITVGPYTDEYGTFVSAFAPVIDPDTGTVILVIGMDVDAAAWKWNVITDEALPMSLTFFLVLLLLFFVKLKKNHIALKAREITLHESEDKYRQLADTAHDIIVTVDFDFNITYANKAAFNFTGVLDPVGMSMLDFTPQHLHPLQKEIMQKRREGFSDMLAFEWEIIHPTGSISTFDIRATLLTEDQKPSGMMFVARDITERKKSEEALGEKSQFIASLLRAIPVAVFYKDKDGRYLGCNDMFTEVMGVTAEQIRGKTVQELWPSELAEKYHSMDLELIRNREHQVYEFKVKAKDGLLHPVIYAKDVFLDKNGEVTGLVGAFLDISGRKQSEEALLASEKKYRELIQNIQAAVVVHGVDTRIQTCNRQAQELLGLTEEQILGKQAIDPDWHFSREDGTAMPLEEYPVMRVLTTRKPFWNAVTGVHRSTKKEDVWVLVSAFPVFDENNELMQIVVTFVDITDRRRAEEDLQKTNQALQAIIDASPLAIFTLDHDLRVTSWSPAAERIFGWSKKEAIGQYNPIVPEEKWGEFKALVSKVLLGSGYSHSEVMRQTKDGRSIYVNVSTEPLRDSSGKVVGAVGVIQDITERKRAEEEKGKLEAQLIQAQKMESIGTLAGGIAHDFNNILAAIIGYSELAIEDVSEPQKATREIKEVLKAADRAKELAKHILTFSRKTDVEYSPIALRTIVKDSIKMLRSVIPTTIDIQQDITDSGLIMSNPTQINQILMNLCTNACHAMDKTGGVLKISLKRVNINKETEAHELNLHLGNYLILSVSDTGHGIPSEILDRIFEPYFTTKEMGRGTGLGLSVVHGIVISHGGNIICKSTLGKGTSFEIYFPEIESMNEVATHEEEEPTPTGKEHILFVDDEPVLVNLAEKMLSKLGYTIETRTSSVEALKLFQSNPDKYDLIITDMTMPGMTGDILAQEFIEIRHDIPIILCSGYSEHISKEKAKKIGIREFVMKPLEMIVLAKTIRRVIDGR